MPRREPIVGQDWCYRCPKSHLITEANHRPVWPSWPLLDNWPAQPCVVPDPVVLDVEPCAEAAE